MWDFIVLLMPNLQSWDGWKNIRMYAYSTAGLGVIGAFSSTASYFPYLTYGSALGAVGVLVQALMSRGWYDEQLTPIKTTAELADPNYTKTKNLALFGSLLVLAVDAFVIAMPFLATPPAVPAPMDEAPVDPKASTDPAATLNAW